MKKFVGKKQLRTVDFMDDEVEIRALTVGDVKAIERETKKMNKKKEEDRDQMQILRFVLKLSVVGAENLTNEEFDGFPIKALTELSEEIMGVKASDIEAQEAKN